jgi:hypothetical protein
MRKEKAKEVVRNPDIWLWVSCIVIFADMGLIGVTMLIKEWRKQ